MACLRIALVALAIVSQIDAKAFHIRFRTFPEDDHKCILTKDEVVPRYRGFSTDDDLEVKFSMKPAVKAPTDTMIETQTEGKVFEVYAKKHSTAFAFMESKCKSHETVKPLELGSQGIQDENGFRAPEPEIRKIVDGGDQNNRIDVVFMGDGYTASEKEKFFSDMNRLTADMFQGDTFKSYLPLFNIWAIYVESVESGIGYDGPKNTPFRLYRQSGTLRAILPGNEMYARQVCRLTGAGGCDYPSMIGNDDFYGGLGGEFVISTKSNRTGTVVLRHEMGHNFVDVGEEYDNGQVYSGVNAARYLATLGWTAWLNGQKREERAIFRLLQYPWADLSKGPQSFTFTSNGQFSRWYMLVSVSAAGEADSLEFVLDGQVLPWTSTGFDDREFYSWYGNEGFTQGTHTFSVRSKTSPTHPDIPRMICSVNLHEYGSEEEYVTDNTHVSAYPTWDVRRVKTFRPTNAGCLMRNMTHPRFCPVCQEGMWAQFLERVDIIDNVTVSSEAVNGKRSVTVNTIKLGQLRDEKSRIAGESLEVKWILNNVEQSEYRDMFTIEAVPGRWKVDVTFVTPEVRKDPTNLLTSSESFTVPAVY